MTDELHSLLLFYRDAGADAALEEKPVNRFEKPAVKPPAPAKAAATAPAPDSPATAKAPEITAAVPDEAQVARAREAARQAASLEELRALLELFDGCNLKFTAKSLVFGDGNPKADLMVIGEAPGREEDLQGLPFVGRSGQLLDRMLKAIGRDRTSTYITNVIPWRPPGNRTPTPHETEICRPFIERHIELIAPKVILALGGPATKATTGATQGIMRLRGNWGVHVTPSGARIPVMATLHPAYLLRNPAHKQLAWRDFLAVKMKLAELAG